MFIRSSWASRKTNSGWAGLKRSMVLAGRRAADAVPVGLVVEVAPRVGLRWDAASPPTSFAASAACRTTWSRCARRSAKSGGSRRGSDPTDQSSQRWRITPSRRPSRRIALPLNPCVRDDPPAWATTVPGAISSTV